MGVQNNFARLDIAGIKQVFDQINHALIRLIDTRQKMMLLVIELTKIAFNQHRQESFNSRKWCAQFVRYNRDEITFNLFDFSVFLGITNNGNATRHPPCLAIDGREADLGPNRLTSFSYKQVLAFGNGFALF